jgi:hypothetical protein
MSSKQENRVYIVAGVHPKHGCIRLDTGHRYTLEEAEDRARYFNNTYAIEKGVLGISIFVAFNVTALDMRPPYAIDMEAEWNYVVDQGNESVYTIENTHSTGSI